MPVFLPRGYQGHACICFTAIYFTPVCFIAVHCAFFCLLFHGVTLLLYLFHGNIFHACLFHSNVLCLFLSPVSWGYVTPVSVSRQYTSGLSVSRLSLFHEDVSCQGYVRSASVLRGYDYYDVCFKLFHWNTHVCLFHISMIAFVLFCFVLRG